jgi:multidrug transporter EmrE-like cation transporter
MATNHVTVMSPRPPLRLWPGVAAVAVQMLLWTASFFIEDGFIYAVLGGTSLALVVLVWWLFFSRASWFERIGALVVMVAAVLAMFRVVHPSVSNGMMGGMLPIFSIPLLCLGWSRGRQ